MVATLGQHETGPVADMLGGGGVCFLQNNIYKKFLRLAVKKTPFLFVVIWGCSTTDDIVITIITFLR